MGKMIQMKLLLIITLFILPVGYMHAQESSSDILNAFNYTSSLPESLLKTKSLVLVQVPPSEKNPELRGDWKAIAAVAQPIFEKSGIDAVVYYYLDDLYSGVAPRQALLSAFEQREITNVIFLIKSERNYHIIVTEITDTKTIIQPGQNAWHSENSDLTVALDHLYKAAANSEQPKENLLILEVPEYGKMVTIIKGRRGTYFDLNFSSEKLAVPIFTDTTLLHQVMAQYPYKYGLTDPSVPDVDLRAQGYQYVLHYVHSTGRSVKEILEYKTSDSETAYISETVRDGVPQTISYPVAQPVYKFYIKHIYSGNVFLGTKWDAAPTWQQALSNYLNNLRKELVR